MKENTEIILKLIPVLLVIAIGLYSFFVRLDLVVLFMGTAALFASIGMIEPKYVRFSRSMSVFFISAAGISSYYSTGNPYIVLLALLLPLLSILQEFKVIQRYRIEHHFFFAFNWHHYAAILSSAIL